MAGRGHEATRPRGDVPGVAPSGFRRQKHARAATPPRLCDTFRRPIPPSSRGRPTSRSRRQCSERFVCPAPHPAPGPRLGVHDHRPWNDGGHRSRAYTAAFISALRCRTARGRGGRSATGFCSTPSDRDPEAGWTAAGWLSSHPADRASRRPIGDPRRAVESRRPTRSRAVMSPHVPKAWVYPFTSLHPARASV
jgi:hypothetical protein